MVQSTKTVPFAKLREMLVAECKKQDKPYGYLFEDITGGFTMTSRGGPQAFKVLPVVVYRVFADGKPDEHVRGVDIVGTPLSCFSKIVATGDDPAVFNGSCGAESGWVPVSAVSPSILVNRSRLKTGAVPDRLPILPPPISRRRLRYDTRTFLMALRTGSSASFPHPALSPGEGELFPAWESSPKPRSASARRHTPLPKERDGVRESAPGNPRTQVSPESQDSNSPFSHTLCQQLVLRLSTKFPMTSCSKLQRRVEAVHDASSGGPGHPVLRPVCRR